MLLVYIALGPEVAVPVEGKSRQEHRTHGARDRKFLDGTVSQAETADLMTGFFAKPDGITVRTDDDCDGAAIVRRDDKLGDRPVWSDAGNLVPDQFSTPHVVVGACFDEYRQAILRRQLELLHLSVSIDPAYRAGRLTGEPDCPAIRGQQPIRAGRPLSWQRLAHVESLNNIPLVVDLDDLILRFQGEPEASLIVKCDAMRLTTVAYFEELGLQVECVTRAMASCSGPVTHRESPSARL